MTATRLFGAVLVLGIPLAGSGCAVAPRSQLNTAEAKNRSLAEQNKAQAAELANLKIHAANIEDKLIEAEQELAVVHDQLGAGGRKLVDYRRKRDDLEAQVRRLAAGQHRIPDEVASQLAELSSRYPSLQFDATTGVSKLDTDIVFNSASAELKPGGEEVVGELVRVLNRPEARDLKILVVGHTDDQRIAKRPARDDYPNNFHLSTARANAVADLMRKKGLQAERMGVAGYGPSQPIAPNASPQDRQKNRRVEIFVMAPDVPVVGWSDSMPSLY